MTTLFTAIAALVVSTLMAPVHADTVYELLGPMVSHHSQQSVIQPYNESHAGLGLRMSKGLGDFGLPSQWGVYVFNDSFRTVSFQSQYGLRTTLGDTANIRWEAAANANVLYKGINWRGGRDWRAVPSLDLMATYDKHWGATLSYYPYHSKNSDSLQQIVTFKVHYRFGETP